MARKTLLNHITTLKLTARKVCGGRVCIPILTVLGSCDSCCYLLFYSETEENLFSFRILVATMKTPWKWAQVKISYFAVHYNIFKWKYFNNLNWWIKICKYYKTCEDYIDYWRLEKYIWHYWAENYLEMKSKLVNFSSFPPLLSMRSFSKPFNRRFYSPPLRLDRILQVEHNVVNFSLLFIMINR